MQKDPFFSSGGFQPHLPARLHANGGRVQVWTVNEVPEMREMLHLNVDSIIKLPGAHGPGAPGTAPSRNPFCLRKRRSPTRDVLRFCSVTSVYFFRLFWHTALPQGQFRWPG